MLDRRDLLRWTGVSALAALATACAPAAAPPSPSPTAPPATAAPLAGAAQPPSGGGTPAAGAAPTATPPGALTAPAPAPARPTEPAAPTAPPSPSPAGPAPTPTPARPAATASPAGAAQAPSGPAAETVYAFNVGSRDVTLIDAATRRPIATRPLGARVRWLSNEQPYWDGQHVWTYDFPDDRLQAIAIEPREVAVARTIPDIGRGPGHSLVVLPGGKKALLNVAGDSFAQLFDARTHQEVRRLEVGPGGANIGFTRDGTQAFIALTGANAVAAIDVARLDVVERIPAGSQPTGLIVR